MVIEAARNFNPSIEGADQSRLLENSKTYANRAIQIVDKFTANINAVPTVRTPLRLLAFKTISFDPRISDEAMEEILGGYKDTIEKENIAARQTLSPSIGTEIEVSRQLFPLWIPLIPSRNKEWKDLSVALRQIGVGVYPEDANRTEFQFPATNTAELQSLMMQQLVDFGFVPTDPGRAASLHINLGLYGTSYDSFTDEEKTRFTTLGTAISDITTYAFISADRIKNRGNADRAFKFHTLGVHKNIVNTKVEDVSEVTRFELRVPRFMGERTYELLESAQTLSMLLHPLDGKSVQGRNISEDFLTDVSSMLEKYELAPNLPAVNQSEAAYAVLKGEIRENERVRLMNELIQIHMDNDVYGFYATPGEYEKLVDTLDRLMTLYRPELSRTIQRDSSKIVEEYTAFVRGIPENDLDGIAKSSKVIINESVSPVEAVNTRRAPKSKKASK